MKKHPPLLLSFIVFVLFFSGSALAATWCNDTDGGYNVEVKGTIFGSLNGTPYAFTDSCNYTLLTEYYCSGDFYNYVIYDCYYNYSGCSNGACYGATTTTSVTTSSTVNTTSTSTTTVSTTTINPDSCTDTDGGKNYSVKGTVHIYLNGTYYNYTDYCYGMQGDKYLWEFYCVGNDPKQETYYCEDNHTECRDGACRITTSTSTSSTTSTTTSTTTTKKSVQSHTSSGGYQSLGNIFMGFLEQMWRGLTSYFFVVHN